MLAVVQQKKLNEFAKNGESDAASRLPSEYMVLKSRLAKLFYNAANHQTKIQTDYLAVMEAILNIALTNKWGFQLLLSQEKEDFLINQKEILSLAKTYLTLDHLINQSYFTRQQTTLVHAWHIFIKYGLVDLHFSIQELETAFLNYEMTVS